MPVLKAAVELRERCPFTYGARFSHSRRSADLRPSAALRSPLGDLQRLFMTVSVTAPNHAS
jgi:hypothetical protein